MNRIEKLLKKIEKLKIDGMIINDSYNRRYLSGFTGSNGYLYISKNKQVLLTDFRYIEQANIQSPEFKVIDIKVGLMEALKEIITEDHSKIIGFEEEVVTYSLYKELKKTLDQQELVGLKGVVEEIRMVKDEEEIENIKQAATIGDEAFKYILDIIKPGKTEKEIAIELEIYMKKKGAQKLSFDTIVASGTQSSLPHAQPSDKVIEKGDFVTMDFGCVYKGYCSDMTRTIVVGKANNEQKKIYDIVLKAQQAALNYIKVGLTGEQVDKVARDIIITEGYGDKFGHGLGHSLGLFIHEGPRLSLKSKDVLLENMVVTIEPGIYVPKFGGVRIEDLICLKEDRIINFVSSPKHLIEL